MKRHRKRVFPVVGALTWGLCFVASACSQNTQTTICSRVESVSLAVGTLRGGVDTLADQVAGDLDANISDSLVLLDSVAVEAPETVLGHVTALQTSLKAMQKAFDDVDWNFDVAQADPSVESAMAVFEGESAIADVTTVSNYVTGICSSGSTVDPASDGLGTLPDQSIPTPPVTDPPIGEVDNGSDARALGYEIATNFGITATDDQLVCLGTKLQDVVDTSDASSSTGAYNRQFQAAFDVCGIDFTIPAS